MTETCEHHVMAAMTPNRIEALSDSIFAFAMTLLVLTIDTPKKGVLPVFELQRILMGQFQEIFNCALSFILIAIFWMLHHEQFNFIKRIDHKHLWINIVMLMFISFLPFSTSVVGDFPYEGTAELFFAANIFIIGVLNCAGWAYATIGKRLVDSSLDRGCIAVEMRRASIFPAVSILAILVSFIHPIGSSYIYILVPVLLLLPQFRHYRGQHK